MKKRIFWYAIALATAGLNYVVFYFVAQLFGSTISHFIAFNLILAMFVHEMGHLIAFEINGIPSRMIFLIVMGGTSPILERDNRRFDRLSWAKQSGAILAGVMGNIAIIIGALILCQTHFIAQNEFLKIVNLNALLIFWNLLPIGKFDGGHFSKMLFNSVAENRDTKFEIGLILWFSLTMIIIGILCGKFSFINFWLFSWGIHIRAKTDDLRGSYDHRAIPRKHQKWWAILYLLLMSTALILMYVVPQKWYL